ncbi:ataxin-2-like protein isoform X1 [Salvelinus fontinalis]|uniref:ataxin-2-like protein isoform X1 n=1 Tax=Salvelinus fontinalis TaxID=8038 RepID=UPI002486AC96|nr:ataxin-2-like protein isoform X1 [Salvelinus fontinalis]
MSFRRQNQQPGSGGRKTSNGTAGPAALPSHISGNNTNRAVPGRTRNTMKPPSQSSPVFEGVYNNTRMLHYLTAVVGSTCDVRVKSGNVYEGIFKTLSSRCELVVDAVHKRSEGGEADGGGGGGLPPSLPRIEEITDTMIFSPGDLVTMTCRDVDLNYAIRDAFTDTAIGSSRVNGEHREKVLQRWDGGDSNGEGFDLETDTSNGWDASEMFKFNEETYGVTSTYDSSLSMYTVPLERGSSDGFRQREARAARLANEIEGSPQYRHRTNLENDDKSEEDKYSAVVRERDEGRERGSPGFQSSAGSREGKYIPLPQRAREMGVPPSSLRGGGSGPIPNRTGVPGSSRPSQGSDRCSPLSIRGAYSPHQSQASPPGQPSSPTPSSTSHPIPHSISHPQALADASRSSVNGVSSRTSPKAQRSVQTNRTLRNPSSQSSPAVSRSPKPDDPALAGPSYLDTSSSSIASATPKSSGPTPLFTVDVNEILSSAAKERTEGPASPQDSKSGKVPSVLQRTQLEELRKFGKEFRLQPSPSPSAGPTSSESAQPSPSDSATTAESVPAPGHTPSQDPQTGEGSSFTLTPTTPTPSLSPNTSSQSSGPDRQATGTPQPARSPGSEEEGSERAEGVADQVKKSTLNPNAKEFVFKAPMTLVKPSPAPTPPRPTPPSPSVVLQPPPGQQAIYSTPYLSYLSPVQIQGHSVQAPQMYQYTMSTVQQGKYPRSKGQVVGPRPDHHGSSQPQMLQAAASAAGPPLVASPYPQAYLQYSQVIQGMPHYPGQPVYSMLQGGARMLTQAGHPQALGPQYPGQTEGPPGPQQAMYASQQFSHHSSSMHPPQPSSTPTGSQPPPQHTAPSPGHGQPGQGGPQPQSMYHSGPLPAPTPPNMPPGHSSPQASYPMQGYSLPTHQPMAQHYPGLGQLTQAHVAQGMSGPHHPGGHGPPQMMLHYAPPPQQGPGSAQQHGPPPQQGAHQHYYIQHPQAVQVQAHPTQQLSFHPPGN